MSGIVFAAVAPHGDLAVAEACDRASLPLASVTRRAMTELGRRCAAAHPDTVVVFTPHNVHVDWAMAVITSARLSGRLDQAAGPVELSCAVDRELALAARDALLAAGVPAVGVSFGGNDPAEAVSPLDWGALVPLWHLGGRFDPQPRVVVIAPARDLDAATHVRAGAALASVARSLGRRVAVIASADQGHGHSDVGPYGYHAESAAFDRRVCAAVEASRLDALLEITEAEVEVAVADSWWQMVMLHGAAGPGARCELLAYEAPTYYGMLCAEVVPLTAQPAAGGSVLS
ncbi:MAG: hypothetical protein ABR541_08140 [Candidatus Dormibacteria bacterium]